MLAMEFLAQHRYRSTEVAVSKTVNKEEGQQSKLRDDWQISVCLLATLSSPSENRCKAENANSARLIIPVSGGFKQELSMANTIDFLPQSSEQMKKPSVPSKQQKRQMETCIEKSPSKTQWFWKSK